MQELGLISAEIRHIAQADVLYRTAAPPSQSVVRIPPRSLVAPVTGVLSRKFGPYRDKQTKALLTRQGIEIRVPGESHVRAVADGEIRYIGPVRTLKRVIVTYHGDYYSILGNLTDVAVRTGVQVLAGQVLGNVQKHVYLEIRAHVGPSGIPVDPAPLLGGGGGTELTF